MKFVTFFSILVIYVFVLSFFIIYIEFFDSSFLFYNIVNSNPVLRESTLLMIPVMNNTINHNFCYSTIFVVHKRENAKVKEFYSANMSYDAKNWFFLSGEITTGFVGKGQLRKYNNLPAQAFIVSLSNKVYGLNVSSANTTLFFDVDETFDLAYFCLTKDDGMVWSRSIKNFEGMNCSYVGVGCKDRDNTEFLVKSLIRRQRE